MKKSILAAALLGAVTVPASADISLVFEGRTLSSPSTWSYSAWSSLGSGPWTPSDIPAIILYDIPGFVSGSATFNPFSQSGSQFWSVSEDPGFGGDPGLVDIMIEFTDAGPGDSAPLGDAENAIDEDSDSILDRQYYGDLSFQSLYTLAQFGLYDSTVANSSWQGEVLIPFFRAPVTEIPEASTVLSMGALVGLGAGAWMKRRNAASAK